MAANSGGVMSQSQENDAQRKESFASVLSRSVVSNSKKNVLEVILEKDVRGSFIVSDVECAKFLGKIGLDIRPGVHIEGVQICPNGRGVLYITLRDQIDISKFCRYDVIEVTSSGIRAVLSKPAGKRDVTVTLKGLHPSTGDQLVMSYLEKYGRLVSKKVVYGVFNDGPLKGMQNGDRCYRMEIKPDTNIGSYHVFEGQKVTLKYPGQYQTCGRCLQSSIDCKGKGVARRCEAEGGLRADFNSYILNLWKKLDYYPGQHTSEDGQEGYESESDEICMQYGGKFTPLKTTTAPETFAGVSVRRFPRDMDHGDIIEFLLEHGLPENEIDALQINEGGVVNIRNLDNSICQNMISLIHGKKYFSRKMFCNGLVLLTPEKEKDTESEVQVDIPGGEPEKIDRGVYSVPQLVSEPSLVSETCATTEPTLVSNVNEIQEETSTEKENLDKGIYSDHFVPKLMSPLSSPTWPSFDREDLARRHSLSLLNRTPPPNSLAEELLGSNLLKEPSKNLALMNSIRDLTESLSEFNSCISTSEGSESEASFSKRGLKKRKRKKTPDKQELFKKANLKVSPETVTSNQN